jgi:hypothetical protein
VRSLERTEKLSPVACAQLWEDLASANAGRAYRAIARLASDPDAAIPLLKKHLRAEADPDPKLVARLLANLASDQFPIRKSASDKLEKFGELITLALKEAAGKNPPLEVARRLALLQEKALRAHLGPEKLRKVRALLVLEGSARGKHDSFCKQSPAGRWPLASRKTRAPPWNDAHDPHFVDARVPLRPLLKVNS